MIELWTFLQGYGVEDGVFCGVFDGHGRNGHRVSKVVRDRLPSLLLDHRNALLLSDEDHDSDAESSEDFDDSSISSPEMFDEWKEACVSAFKAMDKELGMDADLECRCSGTTAVTIIKQVGFFRLLLNPPNSGNEFFDSAINTVSMNVIGQGPDNRQPGGFEGGPGHPLRGR